MIADPVAIGVILAGVVALSLELEKRVRLVRALGAAIVAILLSSSLSNLGILPASSPTYSWLSNWGVNFSIVLILVGVDLRSVLRAGPAMLFAFTLGAFGSVAGTLTAFALLGNRIGPEAWKLAGQYTGTYVGGGINFAALAREFETSSDLFTAAVAADIVVTMIWFLACLTVPLILGAPRTDPSPEAVLDPAPSVFTLEDSLRRTRDGVQLHEVATLGLLSLGLVWLSGLLRESISSIPGVLWLTSLGVVAGQIPAVRRLNGGPLLGNYLLFLFLAGNGARSVIANIVSIGPHIFYFALISVTVHGVILFGFGRLFRLKPALLAVASQATVGGAASALALASARRYTEELLPGIAAGLLGYALGNYLGVLVATVTRSLSH